MKNPAPRTLAVGYGGRLIHNSLTCCRICCIRETNQRASLLFALDAAQFPSTRGAKSPDCAPYKRPCVCIKMHTAKASRRFCPRTLRWPRFARETHSVLELSLIFTRWSSKWHCDEL